MLKAKVICRSRATRSVRRVEKFQNKAPEKESGRGVGEPVMKLPGSLGIPEEAEDCKFNATVIVSTMAFSPAAAPSSPGTVMELIQVGQKGRGRGGGRRGEVPLNPETDSEKQNGIVAKRRGIRGLDFNKGPREESLREN